MTDELTKVAQDSARGGLFLLSGTALSTVILAIGSILIARYLGPELYGQYSLTFVVPQLLFIFTDLGITQGITKFTAELRTQGKIEQATKIIKYGLLLRASSGIIIFLFNYAFAETFASILLQRPDLTFYVQIASTSILFQVIFTTATSAFVGMDKTEYSALTTNIQAITKSILSITFVLLGFSVLGAIVGYTAGYIISAGAGIVLLYLMLRRKVSKSTQSFGESAKTLINYGGPLYVTILLTGFIPLFQNIMLAIFTTDSSIGNYKAAINFATLLTVLAIPITTALLPAFSKLNSTDSKKITLFFKLANKYTAMIVVPVTLMLIMFSTQVVQIVYGSTYQSAPLFLATYCILYFLVGVGHLVLPSFFNGIGKTRISLRMSLITFIILIGLTPILVNIYNVQGLIVAFLIASATGTIYGAFIAKRQYQVTFAVGCLLKIYVVSALSSIPSFLIISYAGFSELSTVIVGGILYLTIYTTLVPLTKIITLPEIQKAINATKSIRVLSLITKPLLKYQQKILEKSYNKGIPPRS